MYLKFKFGGNYLYLKYNILSIYINATQAHENSNVVTPNTSRSAMTQSEHKKLIIEKN